MLRYVLGGLLFALSSVVCAAPLQDQAAAKANTKVDAVVEIDKNAVACGHAGSSKLVRKTGSRIMTGRRVKGARAKMLAKGKLACMPSRGGIIDKPDHESLRPVFSRGGPRKGESGF